MELGLNNSFRVRTGAQCYPVATRNAGWSRDVTGLLFFVLVLSCDSFHHQVMVKGNSINNPLVCHRHDTWCNQWNRWDTQHLHMFLAAFTIPLVLTLVSDLRHCTVGTTFKCYYNVSGTTLWHSIALFSKKNFHMFINIYQGQASLWRSRSDVTQFEILSLSEKGFIVYRSFCQCVKATWQLSTKIHFLPQTNVSVTARLYKFISSHRARPPWELWL